MAYEVPRLPARWANSVLRRARHEDTWGAELHAAPVQSPADHRGRAGGEDQRFYLRIWREDGYENGNVGTEKNKDVHMLQTKRVEGRIYVYLRIPRSTNSSMTSGKL